MHVLGKFKQHQRRVKEDDESQKKLSIISEPHIRGISRLPVELWALVIEHMVVDQLRNLHLQCWKLSNILQSRLVCRVFDQEIQRALHQRIRLPQIPHLALMRTLIRQSYVQDDCPVLHISLFASAIYNSTKTLSPRGSESGYKTPRIAQRIHNCIAIASHITPSCSTTNLLRCLATAASTSIYIQEYIYMPSYYEQLFQTHAEGEACLEVALLVVCGYEMAEVVKTMVGLAEKGVLRPYAKGKYEWDVRRERRWGGGGEVGKRQYGRSDFGFLGGETMLW